ncbi:GFA family protein [Shinella sp. H4-D48]|uniref:GFA family protein n=1 Tax=Shinella sp. H4-D48 TaxID=2925841 RepID=UPI001F53512B|nr:GFA family protein [Shinella sp. H4-D48]UNK37958.1 GFA family protein [Shinella sp. H4-D48]
MRIDGQCHCGFVTYEADIDPDALLICHCTDCQRLTGSPYRVTVRVPQADLTLTGETPKVYTKIAESGRERFLHFCPAAAFWGIRWGSINQRATLKPKRQIWCSSAMDWFGETGALPGASQE